MSFTLDPRSCLESFRAQGTSTVEGGTGLFTAATGSFAATVIGRGLARRNPDGSCSQDQAPRFEEDTLTLSGSLSF